MSVKSLVAIAGLIAGSLAFGDRASAQIIRTGGYGYSPGVVTTSSYYTPATNWSYYSSPAYYSTPYVSSYYSTPLYGGFYSSPYYAGGYSSYYGSYPNYGTGVYVGVGPRRWWR
jgi:hypothetical protein